MTDVILIQMYLHLDIISWHIEADSNLGIAYVTESPTVRVILLVDELGFCTYFLQADKDSESSIRALNISTSSETR